MIKWGQLYNRVVSYTKFDQAKTSLQNNIERSNS